MKIVGLVGKAGSGKDYMAKALQERLGFHPIALADHLKVDLIARGQILFSEAYGQNRPELARTRMQLYGTEETKPRFGEDYWCRCLNAWMHIFEMRWGVDKFVIPDVRFIVEAQWIKSRGGLVLRLVGAERDAMTAAQKQHRSETELERIEADVTIDNCRERWVHQPGRGNSRLEVVQHVAKWFC